jgi:hypothetical protein
MPMAASTSSVQQRPQPFDPSLAHRRKLMESNLLGGKGIHEGLTDRQIRRLCCVGLAGLEPATERFMSRLL